MRGKECVNSQRNNKERASTLPRSKPSAPKSMTASVKPNICISPAPLPSSSPTLPSLKPRPRDSLLSPAWELGEFHPIPQQPDPKPRVSPTLTVPTPRLSPTPSSATQSQQERQPSPIAQERHARSIFISNMTVGPSKDIKHEVLDQGTLLHFTHPGKKNVSREPRHTTEISRLPATSHKACIVQSKVGLKKAEITDTDRPKTLNRDHNIVTTPKPKLITKQQKQCDPSQATSSSDTVPPMSDVPSVNSRLLSRLADNSLKNNYTHTSFCAPFNQSFVQTDPNKGTKLTQLSPCTDSQNSLYSDKSETRRKFDHDTEKRRKEREAQSLKSKSPQHQISLPDQTPSHCTQTDVKSAVSWSEKSLGDLSCQSRDLSQILQKHWSEQRLNHVKTSMGASKSLGTFQPVSDESLNSQHGSCSNIDRRLTHLWNQELTEERENQKDINFSHRALNQTSVFKTPDHNEAATALPKNPWASTVAECPFKTNRPSNNFNRATDWLQQAFHQPSEETATPGHQQNHQPNYSDLYRAFITEDSEDPYYVTMHYPDSVYVGEYKHVQNTINTSFNQSQSME